MTKTLTEQWREGTLKGYYYVHIKLDEHCEYDDIDLIDELTGNFELHCDDYIKEVLAPVPSYEKVKEMSQKIERLEFDNEALEMAHNELVQKMHILEKKLEIATKALKKYQEAINRFKKDPMNNIIMLAHQLIYGIDTDSREALKRMEGVK